MRRGGKEPELQVSAQEKPIVCERMHGERACAALDKAASDRQHCSGISKKKGLHATHPAQLRTRPARGHGSVVAKPRSGAAPCPAAPPAFPPVQPRGAHPQPGDVGGSPLPRGRHRPLSASSAPVALH